MSDFVCVFCGLLCDDLKRTKVNSVCSRAKKYYENLPSDVISARISNKPVSLEDAILKAAGMLKAARAPLFSGLGTDINGQRMVLRLADRLGGFVDHMHSDTTLRNFQIVHQHGWILTTLSEMKNRMTVLVVVGKDALTEHPRLLDRLNYNSSIYGKHKERSKILIHIGPSRSTEAPGFSKRIAIPATDHEIPNVMAKLSAMVRNTATTNQPVQKMDKKYIEAATIIRDASYGVMLWNPARLDPIAGSVIIYVMCELIKFLNKTNRFAGFSLAGNDGAASATSVSNWQTGFPGRVGFKKHFPDFQPDLYSATSLLQNNLVDINLFISSFSDAKPPQAKEVPLIVLGRSDLACSKQADIFIPAAIPGIHHHGQMVRTDNIVNMPLYKLQDSTYLPVHIILQEIEKRIVQCL